jgi:hypothetical protein
MREDEIKGKETGDGGRRGNELKNEELKGNDR